MPSQVVLKPSTFLRIRFLTVTQVEKLVTLNLFGRKDNERDPQGRIF